MKSIDKGMSSSVIVLSVLLFIQSVFPYYLFASFEFRPGQFLASGGRNLITEQTFPIQSVLDNENRLEEIDWLDLEQNSINETKEQSVIKLMIPGGPDQPEVQSFTPMGTDGMVDPFSGDFSYNIPLMDIDGYPINIGYNAGVGMDQEATWVGLGWNLNPGVINRSMRGIPDDFNGTDQMKEEKNQKINKSVTVNVGADVELFAFDVAGNKTKVAEDKNLSFSLSGSLGVSYSNYNGYNADLSFGPSFSIGKDVGLDVGLQFSSSTQGGASIGGNVGLKAKDETTTTKLSIGSSVNSRQGLQQLSINLSQSKNVTSTRTKNGVKSSVKGAVGGSIGSSFTFGMSTHTPQLRYETKSKAFTARFKIGSDAVGTDISMTFSGSFYESYLKEKSISRNAYGYRHLGLGQNDIRGQLDFNRENDGSFTINTPAIALTHLTYDIFSISGHGVGGSYRMDRSEIGHTFDPLVYNSSNSTSVGAEANLGATAKGGVDVSTTFTNSYSSGWISNNQAATILRYNTSLPKFRDASELSYDRSDLEFENIGGDKAVYLALRSVGALSNSLNDGRGYSKSLSSASKSSYFQTNQVLTPYTIGELKNNVGYGSNRELQHVQCIAGIDHHIGAFTVTKTDGMRYYYGLPAVSIEQENVSFAVGKTYDHSSVSTPNAQTGLIQYGGTDATLINRKGIDNYFSKQITPKYIHSYLLTSVLSPNYVDSDNIPGPSKGDKGDYILFDYAKLENYKWRNPVEQDTAFYDAGLNTDVTDDKANYIYGKKDLYYLETITTKNHIAVFHKSARHDGAPVLGSNGGLQADTNLYMRRLNAIVLYSRSDYERNPSTAVPIKSVHFAYSYRLCSNYPGNVNPSGNERGNGKLTLDALYFTYGHSKKGTLNKYIFEYGNNPTYNPKNVDRWGTYKENPSGITNDIVTSPLRNSDFPYVGNDRRSADVYAGAWNLSTIHTPTGGKIEVIYEADDYAFVQHKRATQMFLISGVDGQDPDGNGVVSISDNGSRNRALKFDLLPNTQVRDYVKIGDIIYFRAALSMDKHKTKFDYVPGYAEVTDVWQDGNQGVISLKPGTFRDSGNDRYNPISISGVQFARNYLSRLIPPTSGSGTLPDLGPLETMKAMAAAFVNLRELFTGPNLPLWRDDIGSNLLLNKSWIRLQNPNYKKLGGGHRVKEIRMYDNWDEMVPNGQLSYYGQEYIYEEDGRSTGVAAYEPQIGGEENVWRTYVANDISMTWAPDSRNYLETPFGEQMFPNPSVGYAKVTTKAISHAGVTRTATGKTVNEFYTSKDFPTIVKYTKVDNREYKINQNLILLARNVDQLALSQGFVIENNDMNGKPKATFIYGEGQNALLSSVEYKYKTQPIVQDGVNAFKLVNEATVIEKDGTVKNVVIGRTYEAVADFRESGSNVSGGGVAFNLNFTLPFVLVPMILGSNISWGNTELRTASFTKTIERKGLLYQTIAIDNQSRIVTDNLAYDANTGEVLLTSVNNAYGDTVYNFTYPAHWIYDGMGQAYRNLGFVSNRSHQFRNGYTTTLTNSQLVEGDEVIYSTNSGSNLRGWITEVSSQGIRLLNNSNNPVDDNVFYIKVMRSGRRNLQSTPVGTLTLSKNPLQTLRGNVFEEVLSAEAIQYDTEWKMFCNCEGDINYSNPYKFGLKGNWFPTATYVHLSNRTQEFENQNTNIRKDGVYESFNPMFKLENGKWTFDKRNWTFTSQVTEFTPNGQPIETKDALNRYSSSQMGYNQTHQVAMGVNAQKRQIGATNFEDYLHNHCPDRYIVWKKGSNEIGINDLQEGVAHTGRYSLKVSAGASVLFSDTIAVACEATPLCDFSDLVSGSGNQTIINIPFNAGVQMSYEIQFGTPTPQLVESSTGMRLSFSSSSAFKVVVELLDEKGCFENIVIEQ